MEPLSHTEQVIEGFQLSPQQRRLWRVQGETGGAPFASRCALHVEGDLEPDRLRAALDLVVERNEILRTGFPTIAGMLFPLQSIHENSDLCFKELDITALSRSRQDSEIEGLVHGAEPGVLAEPGPAMAVTLLRAGPSRYRLVLALPALCTDSRGLDNLMGEIASCYGFLAGVVDPIEEPVQYADLAQWQNEVLEAEDSRAGLEYWRRQAAGSSLDVRFPFELAADNGQAFEPAFLRIPASRQTGHDLTTLARRYGAALDEVLLVSWSVLLERLAGASEVGLAVARDGRNYAELEGALGLFERHLPLVPASLPPAGFGALLEQARESLAEHDCWQQCFAWENAFGAGGEAESPGYLPAAFVFESSPPVHRASGVTFTMGEKNSLTEPFTVRLRGVRHGEQVDLQVQYDRSRVRATDAERLGEGLLALIHGAALGGGDSVEHLSPVAPSEERELRVELNRTETAPRSENGIHEWIAAQAARHGALPAVVCGDRLLTYSELEERAGRLAGVLRRWGVGPEVPVALFLERSPDFVVAMLATFKAGGFYVPLDPASPPSRLAYLLEDCGAKLVVTQRPLAATLPREGSPLLFLDGDWQGQAPPAAAAEAARCRPGPEQLAYQMYTSGSSGRPKAVAVEHRQLLAYVQGIRTRLGLPAGSSFATVSTFAADLGHTAVFAALAGGGSLHVVPQDWVADGAALARCFRARPIDCLKIVPSHLAALLATRRAQDVLPRRWLVLGGEPCDWSLVARVRSLAPGCRILNHYGPTEATVGALTHAVEKRDPRCATVAIGRPLAHRQVYVLDRRWRPVPKWVAGEVHLGGRGIARGYPGRPAATAQRFVPDPWGGRAGERLYRTGDLARHLDDGSLEFLGRADLQIKLRGFRVEPGEIESTLLGHPKVGATAVQLREFDAGDRRLVAYVVWNGAEAGAAGQLRSYLREHLPEQMVPAAFVFLNALPLTPNGKIDRASLPRPEASRTEAEAVSASPRSQVEEILAGLWAEILQLDSVGAGDDFFELGGHSLLVTRVLSRVREVFAVEIRLQAFFEEPTLAGLARRIQAGRQADDGDRPPPLEPVDRGGELPLSFAQQRLWFFAQLAPESAFYNIFSPLEVRGDLDVEAFRRALSEIVRRHEVLRTTFGKKGGRPVQVVVPAEILSVPCVDLRSVPETRRQRLVSTLSSEEARRPFRFDRAPLLRCTALWLDELEYAILFTLHHIVGDAWSMGLLIDEVSELYAAFVAGKPSPLEALPVQYGDFAVWQREWLRGDVLRRELAFWRSRLQTADILALPTDRPRPEFQEHRGAGEPVELSAELTAELKRLSRGEGTTLFMTLYAAFLVLLHHHARQDDLVVGTNVANRDRLETEALIGCFVNQLVLRADLSGDPDFTQVLDRARRVCLEAFEHQNLPFEKLVEELRPERDPSRSLLYQAKIDLQPARRPLSLPGLELAHLGVDYVLARYDLHFFLVDDPDGLRGELLYDAHLFRATTARRWVLHFGHILAEAVRDPHLRLRELERGLGKLDSESRVEGEKSYGDAMASGLRSLRRRAAAGALQG